MSIIESDPSLALQGAHVAALKADAALASLGLGGRVFDRIPSDAPFPYIAVGDDRCIPQDSVCGSDTVLISTLRAYSRAPGKVEAKRMAERLRFLLTREGGFTVPGFRLTVGYCEGWQIIQHTDGLTHHAEVDFRYRLIPVAP